MKIVKVMAVAALVSCGASMVAGLNDNVSVVWEKAHSLLRRLYQAEQDVLENRDTDNVALTRFYNEKFSMDALVLRGFIKKYYPNHPEALSLLAKLEELESQIFTETDDTLVKLSAEQFKATAQALEMIFITNKDVRSYP
jgi:hypothetical protein